MPAAKPRVPKVCLRCGAEFSVWPSVDKRGGGSYCGTECHKQAFAHGKKATGPDNPMWKGGITCKGGGYVHVKAPLHPRAQSGYVPEHIMVAEQALGKPLPPAAPVHHVDLNRANNANNNLVICQDQAYHNLLHKRLRVVLAGGDPNTDKLCTKCHACLDLESSFSKDRSSTDGFTNVCRSCCSKIQKGYREERKKAA